MPLYIEPSKVHQPIESRPRGFWEPIGGQIVCNFVHPNLEHMDNPTNSIETKPISLTEGAIEALNKIRKDESIPDDHFLRVGVKGGGCSGFTYVLGFDVKKDNDEVFEVGGFPVVMQRAHQLYLMGIEIDWSNGLNNRGFVFNNPNATDTCGCGTSFNA